MKDDFPYHLERDFEKIWRKILNRWAGPVIKEIKSVLSQKEVRTDATDSPPSKAAETRVKEILASMKALSLTEKELEEIKKFYFTLNRWSYATASSAIEEVRKLRTRKKKFFPTIELDPDSRAVQQFQDSYVDFNKQLVRQLGKEWSETVTLTMSKGFLDGLGKKGLVEFLIETEKIQKSKAEFWARDQLGDAYAKFTEQRFKEAGIPGYVWMTSQDNRVRDSHALLHGKFFRFTETPPGLSKPGARFPGEDYNCLPGDMLIGFDSKPKKAFRRYYEGDMVEIKTETGKTLKATPNHPILTTKGWKPICEIMPEDLVTLKSLDAKFQRASELWAENVIQNEFQAESVKGENSQFHGDGQEFELEVMDFSEQIFIPSERNIYIEKDEKILRVSKTEFKGYVYNFETESGHYLSQYSFTVKNCRCRQRPAIDESDALSESQRQKVIAEINRERKKFGEPKVNEE